MITFVYDRHTNKSISAMSKLLPCCSNGMDYVLLTYIMCIIYLIGKIFSNTIDSNNFINYLWNIHITKYV